MGLSTYEYDPARFGEWQLIPDSPAQRRNCPQDLTIRFQLRVEESAFSQEAAAPPEIKQAGRPCFLNVRKFAREFLNCLLQTVEAAHCREVRLQLELRPSVAVRRRRDCL